jgi:serine/threonine-protein kinase
MSSLPDTSPASPAPGQEPLPERIGRYTIRERLGAGGMGTVYKAHDPDLDRPVALKVPRLDGSIEGRPLRVQRFQREARAAARVWHPHVCPIYDVGEDNGCPYVVMAYVEGRSLAAELARRGRYDDPGQAVALACQVLDALGAVHACGVIHRDLKPSNIILDAADRAILTDFGLARCEDDKEHLTSDGVVLGTPAYMAPEQATADASRIGPRTDLYGVGVLLYQMLTGRPPFEGPALTVLSQIAHEAPPPLRQRRPDLAPALEEVVQKALAREPEKRYASAREFAAALCEACTPTLTGFFAPPPDRPLSEGASTQTESAAPRATTRSRRRRWVFLVALFLLSILLLWGLVALIVLNLTPPTSTPPWKTSPKSRNPALDLTILEAAEKGQRVKLQNLLEQGGNPNARSPSSETPLMRAAARGDHSIVEMLIQKCPDLDTNASDEKGETALMKAAAAGQVEVIRTLLAPRSLNVNGRPRPDEVEVNEEDKNGETAMMKARGFPEVQDFLKLHGARGFPRPANTGKAPDTK